ncbi:MAG TPA: hypothetical protein DEP28_05685, partial [Bacteroidetes bacterium]|nr:hypothetical protein [Bacteroidota bacterium]
ILLLHFYNSDMVEIKKLSDINNGCYYFDVAGLPNPFSPSLNTVFGIPKKSIVKIDIYKTINNQNLKSREFCFQIFNDTLESGMYSAIWSEKDEMNNKMPVGIYQYFLQFESLDTNSKTELKTFSKMIVIF